MKGKSFEDLNVYRAAEKLADLIWDVVAGWDEFSRATVGRQLVRAADSVGANIAEGYGRASYADNKRFVAIARGSLCEARHFLRRAHARKLITKAQAEPLKELLATLPRSLNAYIRSIGSSPNDQ
jgi:four helix bundle protein